MQLRPYQEKAKADIYQEWAQGARNVLLRLPTGAGKTVLFSDILHEYKGLSFAVAHRHELVSQMSLTLGMYGVYHNLIASDSTIKEVVKLQQRELGRTFFNQSAPCTVAGVDTLVRRDIPQATRDRVGLWVMDEAHHLLRSNKWGKAAEMFPNAFGLGPTASPKRADGKGLGRHADGVFDVMVGGPSMSELIAMGNLTPYRIICPPSDMDVEHIPTGASGEFTQKGLKTASEESHIVGDVVQNYLKYAAGKLGVTFATDTETATRLAAEYRAAGVPAEVVTAKTPSRIRAEVIRRFAKREIMQLVNVDIFGEGFDLPAIEVVSMARPTQSLALFMQQFGRALRPMPGKEYAIIIDHVLNCVRHRLEWMENTYSWSLDARAKRAGESPLSMPLRVCIECALAYEGISRTCPYCGHTSEPESRAAPEFVDGVLSELSPEALALLRGQVGHADRSPESVRDGMLRAGVDEKVAWAAAKNLRIQQAERVELRESIAWYGGHLRHKGLNDDEIYYKFYERFGMDVLTAQTLGKADTIKLNEKIKKTTEKMT